MEPEKILRQIPENFKAYDNETGEEIKIGDKYKILRLESFESSPQSNAKKVNKFTQL